MEVDRALIDPRMSDNVFLRQRGDYEVADSASDDLLGKTIPGRKENWKVVERVKVEAGETPGFFSYTYKVETEGGVKAFLKASDIGMKNLQGIDFVDRLAMVTQGHRFEREILDHTKGNNMDRIVVALDYGDFEVDFAGLRDRVFYIIFELAKSDLRIIQRKNSSFSYLWSLIALGNFFVGMNQLHTGKICHNDFKPANCLVFEENLQKVADLGRATTDAIKAPHDGLCVGDVRYAAPEQLYASDQVTSGFSEHDRYRAGDLFSLGSVIHYFLAFRMVTPEVIASLDHQFKPQGFYGGWQDSYLTVLPHWRVEFDGLLVRTNAGLQLENRRETEIVQALSRMVKELCEPDPRLRGHPRNQQGQQDKLGLGRYIAELDLLARKARIAGI